MTESSYQAPNFDYLLAELQTIHPVKVRFKDERWEMQLLYAFIFWFNPNFLTHYTTVIGHTIYFPNRRYLQENERGAMKTLAHEMVHIIDGNRLGMGRFAMGYLFPQILALGVLSFPWFGWWALGFLVFLLPMPSPFRTEFECRAYALDILMAHPSMREEVLDNVCVLFESWDYYRMAMDREHVREQLIYWVKAAESGAAPELTKVLLIYEMVLEND